MHSIHSITGLVDEALAGEIREFRSPADGETRMFYEIVIAPSYTPAGLARLRGKSKALRILEAPLRPPAGRSLRQVAGARACMQHTLESFRRFPLCDLCMSPLHT